MLLRFSTDDGQIMINSERVAYILLSGDMTEIGFSGVTGDHVVVHEPYETVVSAFLYPAHYNARGG